ncbi:hypothetical protein B0J13DRAFT_37741 [Dactylonectria estremocensis]|uniref:Uncharacterized protein n=1 Tax=Dactylonectria estremocensis TaxID=1079267 RepID=A0A9P9JEH6_9HYPO|nr:hypothetical protein B0J13DRAFT_37741 [Dactylonectria estremocensis]
MAPHPHLPGSRLASLSPSSSPPLHLSPLPFPHNIPLKRRRRLSLETRRLLPSSPACLFFCVPSAAALGFCFFSILRTSGPASVAASTAHSSGWLPPRAPQPSQPPPSFCAQQRESKERRTLFFTRHFSFDLSALPLRPAFFFPLLPRADRPDPRAW